MPRKSPYLVALTPQERHALEIRTQQYTSPYHNVIRAKIILLAAQGLPNEVIASGLDVARQIVSNLRIWLWGWFRILKHPSRPSSYAESGYNRGGKG